MKSNSKSRKLSFTPRSILKTIGKLNQTLDPDGESKVIQEFRASRQQTITSIRFLVIVIITPLLVSQLSKTFIISPLIKQFWHQEQSNFFFNSFQEEKALDELQRFQEEIRFEGLLGKTPGLSKEIVQQKVKEKVIILTQEYKNKSTNAIANIFTDMLALFTFIILCIFGKQQLLTLKYFSDDIFYGLSDSAKAFLIILSTDIFVGYHSPYGWEIILGTTLSHYGLPENKSLVSLFIATVPVIMDTVFKYWIFRYLNRSSPSAVATYHNMNE